MRKGILIVTQTVDQNDSNLGFFCGWIKEFAKQSEHIYVIANKVGEYDLPQNVTVLSLGKENGASKFVKFFRYWSLLYKYLPKVTGVFVHMAPEYVVYGGWVARLCGKRLSLWYLHASVTWKLRLSNLFVNNIFTAHEDGILLKSRKILVTGHGIDVNKFNVVRMNEFDGITMLTVGRISKSKNLLVLVKSAIILAQKKDKKINFLVVGEPYVKDDDVYLNSIKQYVKENGAEEYINFVGKVSHLELGKYFAKASVFVNASDTGGIDKAVLEAIAARVPVITSNLAFKNLLPELNRFKQNDEQGLVSKILEIKKQDVESLYDIIVREHSLKNTINKILDNISK